LSDGFEKVPWVLKTGNHIQTLDNFVKLKFLFIKVTLFFGWESLFWQPVVKGCLEAEATGVRTLDPQIPSLTP